ncbi:hypothetical protein LNO02_10705 [Klebsiella variicola subsp. variicola]|nr:hypothetical protein [Klebsiella variicola subsp. variicola]
MRSQCYPKKDVAWLENKPEIKELRCSSYYNSYAEKGDGSISKDAIFEIKEDFFRERHVFKDSQLICYFEVDVFDKNKVKVYVKEKATIDNANVLFYHWGGSGTIGDLGKNSYQSNWDLMCSVDSMSDELTCSISQKKLVLYKKSDGYSIVVGGGNYTGSKSYIRVNKDKPFASDTSGYFSPEDTIKIISSINKDSKLTIRYTQDPPNGTIDTVMDMKYFNAAVKVLGEIYNKQK